MFVGDVDALPATPDGLQTASFDGLGLRLLHLLVQRRSQEDFSVLKRLECVGDIRDGLADGGEVLEDLGDGGGHGIASLSIEGYEVSGLPLMGTTQRTPRKPMLLRQEFKTITLAWLSLKATTA